MKKFTLHVILRALQFSYFRIWWQSRFGSFFVGLYYKNDTKSFKIPWVSVHEIEAQNWLLKMKLSLISIKRATNLILSNVSHPIHKNFPFRYHFINCLLGKKKTKNRISNNQMTWANRHISMWKKFHFFLKSDCLTSR